MAHGGRKLLPGREGVGVPDEEVPRVAALWFELAVHRSPLPMRLPRI
jgi:hypothetical protein